MVLAGIVLLVAGLLTLLVLLAYVLRAVREGRRRRDYGERLAAVVVRAEEEHRQRTESATVSAALTALIPAIKQPKDGPRRVA